MGARWFAALGAVVVLAFGAGCAGAGTQTEQSGQEAQSGQAAQSETSTQSGSGPSGSASAELAFSAQTADGSTFEGRQLAGKPALLWFWAPWCPTCRAQAPQVSALAQDHQDELQVVGVGGLDSAAAVKDYAAAVDGFPQLVDVDGAVWRHFGVTAQSTYVLLDADGNVVADGYLDNQELSARVDELVG